MSKPIDINSATFEQLKQIPGIGEKRANKILRRIQEKGSAITIDELKLMSDIPNTLWDPLLESGDITVEPVEKSQMEGLKQITQATKEKDVNQMAKMIEALNNELDIIKKDRTNMQAAFDKNLTDVTLDFKIKLKNTEHEYEKQHQNFVQQQNEKFESFLRESKNREDKLLLEIKTRDMKIENMENVKAATQNVEKFSPDGIYGKASWMSETKPSLSSGDTMMSDTRESWERPSQFLSNKSSYSGYLESNRPSSSTSAPIPPKMATYDGKNDWRPYFVQFNHIANRYKWSNQQQLDKLIECLRDRALKYFTSRPKSVPDDYQAICKKLNERFGSRDLPNVVRRQLQELRQQPEESLEEYAERAQELATDGYPQTPDVFIQIVAIDAFLKGCTDKKAALSAMDKDPDNLDQALRFVKSAVTNQKVILGIKKQDLNVKRVTFQESGTEDEDDEVGQQRGIRAVYRKEDSGLDMNRLETRIKKTEDDLRETKTAVKQILDILKGQTRTDRSRSPTRTSSPGQSPSRNVRRFNCGVEGHFIAQCDRPRNRSPQRYNLRSRSPSPRREDGPLNFNGLKM